MSYILDALRKSEEERQKSRTRPAGSGFTFIRDETAPQKKFAFGMILTGSMLLAIVLLAAGWWWSQKELEPAAPTTQAMPVEPAPATASEEPLAASSAIPETQSATPITDPVSPSPPPSQPAAAIPDLLEMSADFQARVGELKFSGHVYSQEPSLRMIMINEAVVREGDPVSPELILEKITEKGVVLRLDQTRFRVTLF